MIFKVLIQQGFICRPSDPTVSEDAGIEPMQAVANVCNGRQTL
jgi:hypothetical protein